MTAIAACLITIGILLAVEKYALDYGSVARWIAVRFWSVRARIRKRISRWRRTHRCPNGDHRFGRRTTVEINPSGETLRIARCRDCNRIETEDGSVLTVDRPEYIA